MVKTHPTLAQIALFHARHVAAKYHTRTQIATHPWHPTHHFERPSPDALSPKLTSVAPMTLPNRLNINNGRCATRQRRYHAIRNRKCCCQGHVHKTTQVPLQRHGQNDKHEGRGQQQIRLDLKTFLLLYVVRQSASNLAQTAKERPRSAISPSLKHNHAPSKNIVENLT